MTSCNNAPSKIRRGEGKESSFFAPLTKKLSFLMANEIIRPWHIKCSVKGSQRGRQDGRGGGACWGADGEECSHCAHWACTWLLLFLNVPLHHFILLSSLSAKGELFCDFSCTRSFLGSFCSQPLACPPVSLPAPFYIHGVWGEVRVGRWAAGGGRSDAQGQREGRAPEVVGSTPPPEGAAGRAGEDGCEQCHPRLPQVEKVMEGSTMALGAETRVQIPVPSA